MQFWWVVCEKIWYKWDLERLLYIGIGHMQVVRYFNSLKQRSLLEGKSDLSNRGISRIL
jgi:hypothetical protein